MWVIVPRWVGMSKCDGSHRTFVCNEEGMHLYVCSIFMCQYGEGGNLGACMYSVLLDGRICVGSE